MSQSKHTYDSDRQEALDFERLKMTISGHYDATSRDLPPIALPLIISDFRPAEA